MAKLGLISVGVVVGMIGLMMAPHAGAQSQAEPNDPPTRVARIAEISGTVSFRTSSESQWQAALLNYPVISGNSVWIQPRSHAAIDLGAARFYLGSSTELDIIRLNDRSFVASLPNGAIYLRLPDAGAENQYEIETPRGAVEIKEAGQYEIIAGDTRHATVVAAFAGSAEIVGPNFNLALGPGQAAAISGQKDISIATGAARPDDFIRFVQNEERPYQNAGPALNYMSPEVTGYADLDRYGSWEQTTDYGPAWVPQVAPGWAPYRHGRWSYVAPWGWTWIDDAPWGFAPFHFGRWFEFHHRWCWTPGFFRARPVFAPALVSFFGGVGFGPAVGWVPLGPQEVFVPWYRHSRWHMRHVNIANVRNIDRFVNAPNTSIISNLNGFRNQRGATLVGADAMAHSRPISPAFHRMAPGELSRAWTRARPLGAQAPVRPAFDMAGFAPGPRPAAGGAGNFQQRFDMLNRPGRPQPWTGNAPAFTSRSGQPWDLSAPGNAARQWQGRNSAGMPLNWPGRQETWQGGSRDRASVLATRRQTMPLNWQDGPQGGGFAARQQTAPLNWSSDRAGRFAAQQRMLPWQGGRAGGFAPQQFAPRNWQGGGGNQGFSRSWQSRENALGSFAGNRQGGGDRFSGFDRAPQRPAEVPRNQQNLFQFNSGR